MMYRNVLKFVFITYDTSCEIHDSKIKIVYFELLLKHKSFLLTFQ